jgi:hypothetical protein
MASGCHKIFSAKFANPDMETGLSDGPEGLVHLPDGRTSLEKQPKRKKSEKKSIYSFKNSNKSGTAIATTQAR